MSKSTANSSVSQPNGIVPISHPDKTLWPDAGITKNDLADYYDAVAERLLPYLRGRPTTLHHHPDGVDAPGFMRKNIASHAPSFVHRWTTWAPTARRDVTYAVIDNRQALRWCAAQNVTEFHVCLFRTDRPKRLDTLVIDLDPAPASVDAASAALWIREVLDDVDLSSWIKTSGGRGLHIMIPIQRRYGIVELRRLVDAISTEAIRRHPTELTTAFRIADRKDRLFLDCTRVGLGATLIAPWSPRARSRPTVSTPLDWSQVSPEMSLDVFTQHTVLDRHTEPARPSPQRLETACRSLGVSLR